MIAPRLRAWGPTLGATGAFNHQGFTLLEVMVALAFLAISLVALSDLTGNALRNFAYSRDLSNATLLARGKMAELEEKYEDEGFKDQDESLDGSFEEEGHPEFRWKAEVSRPTTELEPAQLLAVLAGQGEDAGSTMELAQQLLGGGSQSGSGSTSLDPTAGLLVGPMQALLTGFGQALKSSVRELKLTVSWEDGKRLREFAVTTILVVICPKAPGGARGQAADLCPSAASSAGGVR